MTIFLLRLSSDFRWCLAVSDPLPRRCRFAIVQARLRHVFGLRTGALFFSFRGSKGATSHPCKWPFFASPELGFRWCLAVSDPLPRGCRFAIVQARLRHVFGLRTGALFFSFRGSKGATSHPCKWPFFASPELGFRWCLAVSDPLPRGCRFAFVQARLRHVFGLRTGALFFSFRGSKGATSHPCNNHFLLRLSSDLGGVWLFRIHCQEAAVLCLSRLGCVTFLVYVLGLSSSPLGVPKVPLRTPANDHFLLRLSSDLGGVWLFRIHCQEAAVLRLSRLGCAMFLVYVLGLSSPLGVPKVPLRTPANDHFLLRLSSDLGGVWLFRIHCQEAAVLRLSRLGCAMFLVYVLGLSSSPLGVPKVPLRTPANDHFLLRLSSDLGGVWLFRIHCQEAAVLCLSRLGCAMFLVYVLGLSSSPLGVPKVPLRTPANDHFLLRLSSDLGGVWLFRIHCQEAAVLCLSRLGCVTFLVYVLGLSSSPLGVPKVPLRTPANDHFLLRLSSDLGGVWLFRIHCQEAAVLRLSRLGCAMFLVYVLGLSSSPLGVPKVPLRTPANDHFLLRLSSDLGGVWLFRIHCQEAAVLCLSRLGCAMFLVYVLGLSSSPLGVPKVPFRTRPVSKKKLPPIDRGRRHGR